MKKIYWVILVAFILMTWISPGHAAKTPYKIGVNLELTGPWAEITKTLKNAMVMEVEKINAKGGINGRPLELLFEDNGFDVGRAAANMTQFTRDQDIFLVA